MKKAMPVNWRTGPWRRAWGWLIRFAYSAPCLGCAGRVRLRSIFGTREAAYCDDCLAGSGPFAENIRAGIDERTF